MIKVNLLKDHAVRTRKTFVKPTISSIGLIYLAIVLVAAGTMGIWSFYINRQIATGIEKRDQLRVEEARLQKLKQEIEKYQKMKDQRQNRIDVIESLKENQKGPVLLLNTVLQSIPRDEDIWLTDLTQKSEGIKIVGFTRRTEVIPDLMSNLTASGIFSTVDLEEIESQKEASKFSLLCTSIHKPQAE